VDDHPGGLVDHGEVFVLVDDVQRDLLGPHLHGVGLGNLEVDGVAGGNAVRGVGRVPVDKDEVAFDQASGRGAAEVLRVLGQKAIEPRRSGRGDQVGFRRT
jgi:hypothetical protein